MARRLNPARPRLVVLIGLPGAGKSTLARALCRRRGWIRLDRDRLKAGKGQAHVSPGARAGKNRSVLFFQKGAANAAVWLLAATLLARGRSVVLDGMTFAAESQRRRARAVARAAGARCVEVFLDCPPALARVRVAASAAAHPAADRDAALVGRVARRLAAPPRRALVLDARAPPALLLRRVLRFA